MPWSALAYGDYRMLWLSGVAQMLTMQMRTLVSAVWLYEATGSGLQLGLLGGVQLLVQLPAILYGGALADQIDRKKLMAYTQLASVVLIGVMTVLAATDSLRPWHIYLVTAILSVSSTLGNPSRSALTANVVPRSHLMHAVALNTATFQIGAVAAPLAFSAAVYLLNNNYAYIFGITTLIALPSVVMPLLIRTSGIPQDRQQEGSVIKRIIDGFRYVKGHPILPGLYAMDIGVTIVSHYRQILPLFADRLFKGGAVTVGYMNAANSAGGILGTFSVLFLTNFRRKGMMVVIATLIYASLLIALGFTTALWLGLIILAGLGASDAVGMATRQTTVQLTTSDNMRGRAVSFSSVSAMTANNLGTLEVGLMSDLIGADNTLILGGGIGIAVVLIVWLTVRGIREYRYPDD
ncbi:MAG: MFS transporter [Chloroflexi bacterium]|nr:MFS transporter [Chloroflexota bacterium]